MIRHTLTFDSRRRILKSILNRVDRNTKKYIEGSSTLRDFMLVAYGGIEWDATLQRLTELISVDKVLAARERVNDFLADTVGTGHASGGDIAEMGAEELIGKEHISELQGNASDREWEVAIRMVNSEASRYARDSLLALEPD